VFQAHRILTIWEISSESRRSICYQSVRTRKKRANNLEEVCGQICEEQLDVGYRVPASGRTGVIWTRSIAGSSGAFNSMVVDLSDLPLIQEEM